MIYPAIDLMNGRCVRLLKGDFNSPTFYDISPQNVIKTYQQDGAEWVHIVDLEGARKGVSEQTGLILELAQESGLKVQTGGGIRDLALIKRLLNEGVERVVIGSLAVTNSQMVRFWLEELNPEQIVLALDVKINASGTPYPTYLGWSQTGQHTLWDILDSYSDLGLRHILVTDISKDGVLNGSNVSLYKKIIELYPYLNLITSGGVGTLNDIKTLKQLNPHGIIIGKALFENRFSVAQAIQC